MCDEKRAWAVCEAVRAARKRKGYTQEKLGKLMNRHPSYVAKVEQGKLTMSLDGLFDFMDALDVDANTIIGAGVTTSSAVAPSIDVMLSVVNGRFCPQSVRNFCPIVAGFNAGTYKVPACVL